MDWQNKTRLKKTARLPYAYIASEEDPLVLIPDQAKTNLVEQAMDHLDQGHSCRKVATWLTEKIGKKISHQGITNIWKEHRGPGSDKPSKTSKRTRESPKESCTQRAASQEDCGNEAQTVVFEPLPGPQTEFLAAPEREVLFGGAASGSKNLQPYCRSPLIFQQRKLQRPAFAANQ